LDHRRSHTFLDLPSLSSEYLSSSSQEGILGLPLLHLAWISLPYRAIHTLTVRHGAGFDRGLLFNASRSQGSAFTVDLVGNYTIFFNAVSPAASGQLGHDRVRSLSVSGLHHNLSLATTYVFPTDSMSQEST
jgi:hypothetical protein